MRTDWLGLLAGTLARWLAPESNWGRLARIRSRVQAAEAAKARGQYREAEDQLDRAFEIARQHWPSDLRRAEGLTLAAEAMEAFGKYALAEELYREALEIREAHLGAGHPEVARSLNNLALLLYEEGKSEEAEKLFVRLTGILESTIGEESWEYATCLNNYAAVLRRLGRTEESGRVLARARAIRARLRAAGRPQTATR